MNDQGPREIKPCVALFCTNFLPYSQSFVFEELQGHTRYEAEVFAWRRMFADRFPFKPVNISNKAYILTRYDRRFVQRFSQRHFALVHAHFGPGATYALPHARRFGLPLVVTFHGYDVPLLLSAARFFPINWPYALRGPEMLRQMTLGLCASQELYHMLQALGVPSDRLAIYRLGIDLSVFTPGIRDSSQIEVMMVGRFVEKKGFTYGIEAFARALQKNARPAHLTLVGSGPCEAELRALVGKLSIDTHVTFAGVLTQGEVAARLGRAHVLLAPSVVGKAGNRESGLIVVKEASACETVPIGTLHGGIPEIIDDQQTGYLVAERDVETMAERLARLIDQPQLRERLGRSARLKMEREYDKRNRVAELESLYDQARALGPAKRRG